MKQQLIIGITSLLAALVLWYWLWPTDTERKISQIEPRSVSGEVLIVAFGDSLTEGYGLPDDESYPAQLEAVLQAEGLAVSVRNEGVSGETSAENSARVQDIVAVEPDVVLLGIGGNDALRSLPVAETKANIAATIVALQAMEQPPVIVLLQMQSPFNAGLSYKQEFDALYPALAKEYGVILLPFATAEVYLKPEYRQADIIHLTKAGYAAVIDFYLKEPLGDIVRQLQGS